MPTPRTILIRDITVTTDKEQLAKAFSILKYAHESASAILKAFDQVRQSARHSGAPSTEDQDLLRAMLVMAAAGLDSILKQIIRDAIGDLAKSDTKVIEGLQTFVSRKLKDDLESGGGKRSREFIEEYISDLTAGSLQSAGEITKIGNALGITDVTMPRDLQEIFKIRNEIIHELDIDFDHRSRNRRPRSRSSMVHHSNAILKTAEDILGAINRKLER